MIKKKLTALAGALLLAAGAQAANTGDLAGTDSSVFVALLNSTGTLIIDATAVSGVTTSDLLNGTGFSIDYTALDASIAGPIDSYAVLATSDQVGSFVPFPVPGFFDPNAGVIWATNAPAAGATGDSLLGSTEYGLFSAYFNDAVSLIGGNNSAFAADGLAGDLDTYGLSVFGGGTLQAAGDVTSLYYRQSDPDNGRAAPSLQTEIVITSPAGADGTAYLDGNTFNVTSAIPVPAAAWLFGSALLGLGVVRRKKQD